MPTTSLTPPTESNSNLLQVTYHSTRKLRAVSKNPRRYRKWRINQIARNIAAFGFIVPVLINWKGEIVAGHGRVEAARRLRLTWVPTIQVDHLTPEQVKAFRIANNLLTDASEWDESLIEYVRRLATTWLIPFHTPCPERYGVFFPFVQILPNES